MRHLTEVQNFEKAAGTTAARCCVAWLPSPPRNTGRITTTLTRAQSGAPVAEKMITPET